MNSNYIVARFTTKQDGPGFGLHSSALVTAELRGNIRVHSDGPGRGAEFTLRLHVATEEAKPAVSQNALPSEP